MAEIVFNNAVKNVDNNTIEVVSSAITKVIDSYSRIVNATLVLHGVAGSNFEVKAQSNGGQFAVIDYISSPVDGKVYLNITEEVGDILRNDKEKVVIS